MAKILHNGKDFSAPDFIIGGAMKSATTSLHHMLAAQPGIFIPDGELRLFGIDDLAQHPEFFYVADDRTWATYDFEKNFSTYLDWYSAFFESAGENQLWGEDTAAYLASDVAPTRIAKYLPSVKLIFLLRNPVDRIYSHYWHWVRSGRAFFSFDDSIRFQTVPLVQRSFYKEQLERYFDQFDSSQIKIILFEQLVRDPEPVVADVMKFLGVDAAPVGLSQSNEKNPGSVPRFVGLKLFQNRLLRQSIGHRYGKFLPGDGKTPARKRLLERIFYRLNKKTYRKPEPMSDETRTFLTELLLRKNAGLTSLLGFSVAEWWGQEYEAL